MSDFQIGTGFVAHHERERGGIGDRMGGGILREFCHGKKFGPFRRLVLCKDSKVGLKFLIYPFGFAVSLGVIGGREGDVVVKESGEFSCEGRAKLGASIRDDLVMKAESGEYMLKKDFGDVRGGCSFVARVENYPLRKTMVYHNQNRIVAVGEREVGDKVHGDLLEGAGALGGNRGEGGVGRVGVYFVGLASSAAGDEFADEGGHARPPIVFL